MRGFPTPEAQKSKMFEIFRHFHPFSMFFCYTRGLYSCEPYSRDETDQREGVLKPG